MDFHFTRLLDNQDKIVQLRETARNYGNKIRWPMIGAKYIKVAASAVEEYYQIQKEKRAVPEPYYLPEFSPIQIESYKDDSGIMQQA